MLLTKVIFLSLLFSSLSYAEGGKKIPDPLALNEALLFSEQPHPNLTTANLYLQAANNQKREAENEGDLTAYFEGRLQYIEPSSIAVDQGHDDHRAGLVISKTLYDSGRNDASVTSASLSIEAQQANKKRIILERRIEIMQKFYDVILADMLFYKYNEEMANKFIRLDRLRDRLELGQASDLDVMEKDVDFKRVRYLRQRSENEQRITRSKLAIAMGRPGELVNAVTKPKHNFKNIKLPSVEILNKISLTNNYEIVARQIQLTEARTRVAFARKVNSPTVSLEAGSYAYSRDLQGRDELQVGVVLRVPLFAGDKSDIEVAKALNRVYQIEADIALIKTKIETSILTLWLEFDSLKSKLQQMEALTDYRELYLDRSRALYELEVKTDLGDAMVRISEAERSYLQTQYEMMIVMAKIELEVGQKLETIKEEGTQQ